MKSCVIFGNILRSCDIWEAFGMHLGSIWDACGTHLGDMLRSLEIWEAFGKHVERIWGTYERHLGRPILQEWLREENHGRAIFHCQNEHVPKKLPGIVNVARHFECRCHQVPKLQIQNGPRPSPAEQERIHGQY